VSAQEVPTRTSVQGVDALNRGDSVAPASSPTFVGTLPQTDRIVSALAIDQVASTPPTQLVSPDASTDEVVASVAVDEV
jgi:hypothetical protein